MLHRSIFCVCFLSLLFSCKKTTKISSSETVTTEERQIAETLIQGAFDNLWSGFDSTKIENYHTDDFIILENGEVWDNQRIKVFMKKQLAIENRAVRTNKMDYISMEKYGQAIYMSYFNFATWTQKDSIVGTGSWLESALAVPTPAGFRLKKMHSTWIPKKG